MTDLYLGAAVISILSGVLATLSGWIASKSNNVVNGLFILAIVLLTILFGVYLHGHPWLAKALPFSNVIIVGNWLPLGIAIIAGAIAGRKSIPTWRRAPWCFLLVLLAGYAMAHPLLVTNPTSRASWTPDGVLLQSNSGSCSSCAAAMLLRDIDVDASEGEMMKLSFTSERGANVLGVYRALCLKTEGKPFKPEIILSTVDALLKEDKWPVQLLVHLEKDANVDSRYQQEWGWQPGLRHAVVLFGKTADGRLDIGDPSVGREAWTVADLRVLWHGEGLRLVPR